MPPAPFCWEIASSVDCIGAGGFGPAAPSTGGSGTQRIKSSVRIGKAMISETRKNSAIRNGTTPLKVSSIDTSPAMFWITYTFSPTGGGNKPSPTTKAPQKAEQKAGCPRGRAQARATTAGKEKGN